MQTTLPRRARAQAGRTGVPQRILLIGGTSEIGLAIVSALPLSEDTELVLAGRDPARMAAAVSKLPCRVATVDYDASAAGTTAQMVSAAFAGEAPDLVISAVGVLTPQEQLDAQPDLASSLVTANFTSHVAALLDIAGRMRAAGRGTIVILSSIAAVRPRKANYVYGAAKAGLDAFGRGLTDALHGTGVRVLLVRPGFVIGRMTAGLDPAPLSSTPAQVGAAVAARIGGPSGVVWVPQALRPVAGLLRLMPRPAWRRMPR